MAINPRFASRCVQAAPEYSLKRSENFISPYWAAEVAPWFFHSRSCDAPNAFSWLSKELQLFVDSIKFGGQGPSDICIFSIKCLLECLLDLSQSFSLTLVGLYIGCKVRELFLNRLASTSTAESRFLSDMILIMFVSYKLRHIAT